MALIVWACASSRIAAATAAHCATLELQPFMVEQPDGTADGTKYELYAVVMHGGGVRSGHYWS